MRRTVHRAFTQVAAKVAIVGLTGLFALVGGLAGSPVVQAAGGTQYHLAIVAHDNGSSTNFQGSFSMPSSVHAGRVEIAFTNGGSVEHMAQFFKLKPGVSEGQFIPELTELFTAKSFPIAAQKIRDLLAIASGGGGPDGEQPGWTENVIEHLTPGTYVVVCLEATPQGVPHFLLGMAARLTVWGNDNFTAPASNGTVIETDHSIAVPAVIHESQPLTLRINVSSQTHEFQLASAAPGTTKAEILACLTNPPGSPLCKLTSFPVDVAGAGGLFPGGSHWIELHLKPGTYVAWCFVPDVHTGMPHALMGMVTVFVVK
ncbi:MAG: hypothetical protein ACHQ4H_07905 [Ktedonobacterales bacterium]